MAAKITVQVHIGVDPLPTPPNQNVSYAEVKLTDCLGIEQSKIIPGDVVPLPDAGGNLHYSISFDQVQSGGETHIEVQCFDTAGGLLGLPATADLLLEKVPDPVQQHYFQPSSIYLTT